MAKPGPKPLTRIRRPLSKEFRANSGKRRPRDPATGHYVVGGEKHLPLPAEAIEREAADKTVASADRLKELAPDIIEFLAHAVHTAHYKIDTRVTAARILLEHALGKPRQAVVPGGSDSDVSMSWEDLLEKISAAAAADARAEGKGPTGDDVH
jgi:hypothetical protein